MDKNMQYVIDKKVENTIQNLAKNNIHACYVPTKEDVIPKVLEFLKDGDKVSCGGSMTLFETGIIEYLRNGKYNYLDRYDPNIPADKMDDLFTDALSCDTYFSSSNAITENGELLNIDGRGNRVAALIYGPKSVIIIAGYNKIVPDINAAYDRAKNIAAPANAKRLGYPIPCGTTGRCMKCSAAAKFCSLFTVIGYQLPIRKDRIKVIFVGEELGY
ncbi:MAG: lactate utilization protein [Eubacteriaceae bacterium]